MFKLISYMHTEPVHDLLNNRRYYYRYKIIDSDFTAQRSVVAIGEPCIAAIVEEYEARNLPVVPNLAIHYSVANDPIEYAIQSCSMFGLYYPSVAYGAKYHECVLRHIRQLQFGRRNRKR